MVELADEDGLYRRLAPHRIRDDRTVNSSAFKRGRGDDPPSRSISHGSPVPRLMRFRLDRSLA